jgi:hypothetical protein
MIQFKPEKVRLLGLLAIDTGQLLVIIAYNSIPEFAFF